MKIIVAAAIVAIPLAVLAWRQPSHQIATAYPGSVYLLNTQTGRLELISGGTGVIRP
jgi:hypothetical protein